MERISDDFEHFPWSGALFVEVGGVEPACGDTVVPGQNVSAQVGMCFRPAVGGLS